MTVRRLGPGELGALLDTVRRSSWRWECQGHYAVDEGELDAWRAGQPIEETDEDRVWHAYIRRLRAAGILFERVRMLTDPLTEYLRWMLSITHANIEAGEDIRWIDQHQATRLGMPGYDFYILDDDRVAVFCFDEQTELIGIDLDDDPEVVRQHQGWRDLVWPLATTHADYIAGNR
ncbi:DUF6879 family protein [Prauserella sp. PE36]|uniref:DUF6879 family protein n=1 Tax=Prauserella sp. PE36 TaxID=1504709 RepID=UPI001F1A26C8|nr:DUF6879 family protein [Prauserella sp. PE36]